MILKYLVNGEVNMDKLFETYREYDPKTIMISDSDKGIVELQIDSESVESANTLSDINANIIKNYDVIVLSNGSSEYYNRRLFPLINTFETRLRELLSLAEAISDFKDERESLSKLDLKSFGDLFKLLFVDRGFESKIKALVNQELNGFISKNVVIERIQGIDEKTLWGKLVGNNTVFSLEENFTLARNYRNDVMHAHYTDRDKYQKAKSLFTAINRQVDSTIGDLLEANAESIKDIKLHLEFSSVMRDLNESTSRFNDYLKIMQNINSWDPSDPMFEELRPSIERPQHKYQIAAPELYAVMLGSQRESEKILNMFESAINAKTLCDEDAPTDNGNEDG